MQAQNEQLGREGAELKETIDGLNGQVEGLK